MKPLETLRRLGSGGEAPADAKQRVYSALMASLAAAATAGTATTLANSASVPAAKASLLVGLGSTKALAIAAGIWLIGGVSGAALYGALHPPEVRVVYVDRPVLARAEPAPVPAVQPLPSASNTAANPVAEPSTKRAQAAPAASAGPGSLLARERALLDLARQGAAHGEPALALKYTDQHRAQFPHGKLTEEREALAIRALLALGRADEARTRAQGFRLAYPNSLLMPVIDSALPAP